MGAAITQEHQIPRGLSLGVLSRRCARETQRFFAREAHDPRFCFELFRRAAEDHNDRAWDLVYQQYHALAHGWVLRHSLFQETGLEVQDVVNEAFARLWKSLDGNEFDRFQNLAAILRYLHMCINSVITDQSRKIEAQNRYVEWGWDSGHRPHNPADEHQQSEEQSLIFEHVKSALKDDAERIVIYETFVLDLRPRQIQDRHQEIFGVVHDVHRVKQNVLSRFKRDPFFKEHI